jgi:hypothetical protein
MHFGQLHAATPCKAYTFFFADDALLGANAGEMDARHVPRRENAVAGLKTGWNSYRRAIYRPSCRRFSLSVLTCGFSIEAGTLARLSSGRDADFATRLERFIRVLRPEGMAACK